MGASSHSRGPGAARFGAIALGVALALLTAVVAFNAIVDPFGMTYLVVKKGFNSYKPSIYPRVRLFKSYEVARVRPRTIVLGSSRSHVGFRCSHEALSRLEGPCYNLAFDGATAKEMYFYLRHANAVRPLEHVLLGLDPYHLTPAPSFTRPDFDPLVLYDSGSLLPRFVTGDLRVLSSLDTVKASVSTLRIQEGDQPTWFAPDGQRLGEIFFRHIDDDFRSLGPRGYFELVDRREVTFQKPPPAEAKASAPAPADPDDTTFSYVRRIVEFCRERQIELHIALTPAHVHQLEITAAYDKWDGLESGTRRLVRMVEEQSAAGHVDIRVFDFSGYSSVTEEPLPPPGGREEMQFYWESSHFKQIVGDYMLDRIYGVSSATRPVPSDFGVRLSSANLESHLAEQRARQVDYRARFPDEVATLRGMVDGAMRDKLAQQ